MTEAEVIALLAKRYAAPVWAFLPQVRNGTGYMKMPRTADALAMALWPSRGLELVGFEVKVARADWLRELKNAEKAEDFFAVCDRWYVVAPAEVIRKDEVPAGWGWLSVGPKGLGVGLEAERKKGADPDRLFLAALLRRVQESTVPRATIEAELTQAREHGRKHAAEAMRHELEAYEALKRTVAEFEKGSGISLGPYEWRGESIGRAVRQVLEHGPEHIRASIQAHRRWLEGLLRECDEQLAEPPAPRGAASEPPGSSAVQGPKVSP